MDVVAAQTKAIAGMFHLPLVPSSLFLLFNVYILN
uniref:Uncharacterized protein n=1 Tax=Arundo donax TaxID=35708 RepID=A0A0A9GIH9_ARUDO